MGRGQNAAILAQVGQFYSDAVVQFYIGANTQPGASSLQSSVSPACLALNSVPSASPPAISAPVTRRGDVVAAPGGASAAASRPHWWVKQVGGVRSQSARQRPRGSQCCRTESSSVKRCPRRANHDNRESSLQSSWSPPPLSLAAKTAASRMSRMGQRATAGGAEVSLIWPTPTGVHAR